MIFIKKYLFPLLTISLLAVILFSSFKFIRKPMIIEEKEAEEVLGPVLKMSPASIGSKIGESFDISLVLDAKNNQATAADLTVSYDPNVLRANYVNKGSFFSKTLRDVSINNGTITVALGCEPTAPKSGEGTLVTINFTVLNYGDISVNYSSGSQVAAIGQPGNIITSSIGTNILIATPTPTPIPTLIPTVTSTPVVIPTPTVTTPIPTPTTVSSRLQIFAAGTKAANHYPNMALIINNEVAAIFYEIKGNPYYRQFKKYSITLPKKISAHDVKIRFINDFHNETEDRNLMIDKIKLDGVDYQTEADTTYSTGTWSKDSGCLAGYKKSEWLHCYGEFRY